MKLINNKYHLLKQIRFQFYLILIVLVKNGNPFINKNYVKGTIETILKSVYFKTLHKAIATKIRRSDDNSCSLFNQLPDFIEHLLVVCAVVTPLWINLEYFLSLKGVQLSSCQILRMYQRSPLFHLY